MIIDAASLNTQESQQEVVEQRHSVIGLVAKALILRKLMVAIAMTISLTACAGNPVTASCSDNNLVSQAFSFGCHGENPDMEILDVYYSIPNSPVNYITSYCNGKPMQSTDIGGSMRRVWKFYVKWQ